MRTFLAVLVMVVVAAHTSSPAEAGCEPKPFTPCLDGLGDSIGDDIGRGVAELMLYTVVGLADAGAIVHDGVAGSESKHAAGVVEIVIGAPQVALFTYRAVSDDDHNELDAAFAVGGGLLLLRGVYLVARSRDETPPILAPAMVAGRPGMTVSGVF